MIETKLLLVILFSIPLGSLFGYIVSLIAIEEIENDLWVYIIVKKVILFSALLLSLYLFRNKIEMFVLLTIVIMALSIINLVNKINKKFSIKAIEIVNFITLFMLMIFTKRLDVISLVFLYAIPSGTILWQKKILKKQ
jgi:hypothetical protein